MDKQILDEHSKIFLDEYKQNFGGVFFHPEAGEDTHLLNESLYNIYKDIVKVDDTLINTGIAIDNLLTNTITRLEEVKKCIIAEKERYQDIQMLCNKYTDFDNINSLESLTFQGVYSEENGVIYAPVKRATNVDIAVISVDGNGYEGNEYVYNNFEYQKNTYDTSLRENIIDNKINTYYEYSRITINNDLEETNTYFNKDNVKARCTITFMASDYVNYVDINTEDLGISIIDVQYSMDGIKYYTLNLPQKITLKDKLDSYENYGYIYGSGLLSLPLCQYFKLTFETDRDKNDTIAYEKTLFEEDIKGYEFIDDPLQGVVLAETKRSPVTKTTTYTVKGAKRSSIKLNNIVAYKKNYNEKSQIMTDELMSIDGFSIAVFANVYIPEGLPEDAVKIQLLINGLVHDVVPINSNSNGIKVIRFSGGKSNTKYTELISEKIKSAKLVITFSNKADVTPFINNVKVLIGGEV